MYQALISLWLDITTPEIPLLTEKRGDSKNGKTIQTSKTNANAHLSPTP